jgi:hypothetical protein
MASLKLSMTRGYSLPPKRKLLLIISEVLTSIR